jgi:Protein of unknown function (DUF3455)
MQKAIRSRVFAALLLNAVIFFSFSGNAQEIRKELQPPSNQQLLVHLRGKGVQIYTCQEGVTQFAWTLKAPEAELFDTSGKPFGKHFAGPSWQANDGSQIIGKAAASAPSPDPDSIPWLLVTVVNRSGEGVLARVTSIQRLNTKGGKAPSFGCDSAHAGQEVRVPYSADYLFFVPK